MGSKRIYNYSSLLQKYCISKSYLSQIVHKRRKTSNLDLAQDVAKLTNEHYTLFYNDKKGQLSKIAKTHRINNSCISRIIKGTRKTNNIKLARDIASVTKESYLKYLTPCKLKSIEYNFDSCADIARHFKVSPSTITRIKKQECKTQNIHLAQAIATLTQQDYSKFLCDKILNIHKRLSTLQ